MYKRVCWGLVSLLVSSVATAKADHEGHGDGVPVRCGDVMAALHTTIVVEYVLVWTSEDAHVWICGCAAARIMYAWMAAHTLR